FAIPRGVHRIVRLIVRTGEARILIRDDGFFLLIVPLGMKVAVFDDPGVRNGLVAVIHHRSALEIADADDLLLEVEGSPGEVSFAVIEVLVDGTGIYDRYLTNQCLLVEGLGAVKEINARAHVYSFLVSHAREPCRVPVLRKTLIRVTEVAVVVGVPNRKPGDDRGGEFTRVGLPLFRGIPANERLIERPADEAAGLVLQVVGRAVDLRRLFRDESSSLARRIRRSEELIDRSEVDRHLKYFTADVGEHMVLIVGEGGEPIDVVPHPLIRGMEQVGAVGVYLDTRLFVHFAVGIAPDVWTAFQHEHAKASVRHAFGDGEAEES